MSESNNITVYVANLGKYNEGELVGGWVTLPKPQAELEQFLRDTVGLELDPALAYEKGMRGERVYEEYAIHDFEFDGALAAINYRPNEYTSLDDLNILAASLADHSDVNLESVYLCAEQIATDLSPLQYANMIVQADEIPFYSYDFTGIEYSGNWSNEEKLGYTLMEGSPVKEYLDQADMLEYFDFEKYGREHAHNCTLADDGYLDNAADFPDVDFYDKDELKEMIEDEHGEDFFKSLKEVDKEKGIQTHSPMSLADRANAAKEMSAGMVQDAPQHDFGMDAR